MNLKRILMVAGVAALSMAAFSQGQGMRFAGPGNPSMLLQRDDVRADLQITDEQKSKLYDLRATIQDRFTQLFRGGGLDDPEVRKKAVDNILKKIVEDVNAILTPAQQTRLGEIYIQITGYSSATQADVQKALAISAGQKTKIDDLNQRQQQAQREAFQKVRDGEIQRQDAEDASKKNAKILNDEIGKILTQAQKDKLKTLGGKPFVAAPETSGTLS